MTRVDGQLVKEHLGSLVGMGQLDATHESNRLPAGDRQEQMVVRVNEKSRDGVWLRRAVEQMAGGQNQGVVPWPEPPDLDARHAARLIPIARRRLFSDSIANAMISLSVCP